MANLFINPGFEEGGIWPDSWVVTENGASILTMEPDVVHSGENSIRMDIDAGNNNVQFYQDLVLTVSIHYYFSLWRMHSLAGKTLKMMIRDSGSNVWLKSDGTWDTVETWITIANVTEWTQFLIDFTSHASYTNYRVIIQSDGAASSSIYMDDTYLDMTADVSAGGYPPNDVAFVDAECLFQYLNPFVVWTAPLDGPVLFELRTENANWGQKTDTFIAQVPGTTTMFEWLDYQSWADNQGLSIDGRKTITIYIKAIDGAGKYSVNADSIALENLAPLASSITFWIENKTIGVLLHFSSDWVGSGLNSWDIYRNTVNDSATATKIATVSEPGNTYLDTAISAGQTYYYWVKLKNSMGLASDFSTVESVTHQMRMSAFIFDQCADADIGAEDGAIGFSTDIVLLQNCDDETQFTSDSAVTGSVVIEKEISDIKQGAAAIKVTLWRYPKFRYYENGPNTFNLGYWGAYNYICQGMKPATNKNIKAIAIPISKKGTPANDVRVSIYNSDLSSELAFATLTAASIPATPAAEPHNYLYAVFGSPVALTAGTLYWIVLYTAQNSLTEYYYVPLYSGSTNQFGDGTEIVKTGETLGSLAAHATWDINFRACETGDALNKYVYATIGAQNISAKTYMRSWIKATRSGGFLSHSFGEAAIGEQNFALTLAAVNAWEWQSSNISAIAAANRDAVTKVGWKITNMDDDVIVRFDYEIANIGEPMIKCVQSGFLLPMIYPSENKVHLFEDFIGIFLAYDAYAGAGYWVIGNAGCWFVDVNVTCGYLAGINGICQIRGDGTNTGILLLGNNYTLFSVQKNLILKSRQAQLTVTTATRRHGFTGASFAAGEPANGLYWRHTAAGNYIAVARNTSTESTVDTAIAAANGAYHSLVLFAKSLGATVSVYIDGVLKGTLSSNIPTVSLGLMAVSGSATNGVGQTIDYLELICDR